MGSSNHCDMAYLFMLSFVFFPVLHFKVIFSCFSFTNPLATMQSPITMRAHLGFCGHISFHPIRGHHLWPFQSFGLLQRLLTSYFLKCLPRTIFQPFGILRIFRKLLQPISINCNSSHSVESIFCSGLPSGSCIKPVARACWIN